MTEKSNDMTKLNMQDVTAVEFKKSIVKLNALASIFKTGTDLSIAKRASENGLQALGVQNGIQEMLAAQMLSIHQLQQQAIALAHGSKHIENIRYFTNTAVKLANCFTQQANALNRLQGNGCQKIVVEHVDVHSGGQAIVGNINEGSPIGKVKK